MPTDNIASRVASRIRELREARHLSVRELARRSGLPPESISRSERELTDITLRSLAKLCRGLMVDLPSFFEFAAESDVSAARQPEIQRAVALLVGLPPAGRAAAVEGLELLLAAGAGGRQVLAVDSDRPRQRVRPAGVDRKACLSAA
jgi:transcriptional regulator with XRE-family HTH domain